ncbi:MAG: GDP-mannose 4,6-dehydratase [Halobacteriota archaeon]|nr:GDP-mannose 4,6-dehydratase [Halobacteriota archaeon]
MRVLVTGGAGFIGSYLVEKLLINDYSVTVVDNLTRGNQNNLSALFKEIEFIEGSVNDFDLMKQLIKESDYVFHLAALSRVMPSIESPEMCFKYNVEGTEIIARLCSKLEKKLFFSSSREVYGDAKYIPVDEEHCLNPKNPYGASKVFGEKIIESYAECYGLSYIIFRLANVYGLKDFERVIPTFVERALKNHSLIVYGGNQILDFVYIDDIVDAFLKTMEIDTIDNILNIGSGTPKKILDLARMIKKITKSEGEVIIKESRGGEVERFVANVEKAKRVLNWEPKTSLGEGLKCLV